MDYSEYYEICKERYSKKTAKEERSRKKEAEFYTDPVRQFDFSKNERYEGILAEISKKAAADFDTSKDISNDGVMIKHEKIWKFKPEIQELCDIFVPILEKELYFCNLYVDKIYIYRTMPMEERKSSYIWHYDNNPLEIVKTIFYLTDVDTIEQSPYEYLLGEQSRGVLCAPTRTGPKNWNPAPNNSRVDKIVESIAPNSGPKSRKVLGKRGTSCSFNNNAIHRANPVLEGHRDVINIRVKPTLDPAPQFANDAWTTGFEKPGVVNPDPTLAWTKLI